MIMPLLEKYVTHYLLYSLGITLMGIHLTCHLNENRRRVFPRLSAFTNEKVQIGLVVDYHIFIIPSIKSF